MTTALNSGVRIVELSKKKLLAFVLAAAVSFGAICDVDAATRAEIGQITVNKRGSNFKCWNKDAASYQALTKYVKEITKKNSKSYIPVEDRVAVFDMDGTILCETAPYYLSQMLILDRALHDKSYTAPAETGSSRRLWTHGLKTRIQAKSRAAVLRILLRSFPG